MLSYDQKRNQLIREHKKLSPEAQGAVFVYAKWLDDGDLQAHVLSSGGAKADYEGCKERRAKIDPVTVRRHREASQSVDFILIGLPLYLWHWLIIRK
jgi:hypothetical protein